MKLNKKINKKEEQVKLKNNQRRQLIKKKRN